jgi:hypothetical protein
VTRLAFLSPHECDDGVAIVSPLRHATSDAVTDVSHLGKLEVRGGVPFEAIPIGPDRALVVVDGDDVRATRDQLVADGLRVYDMTAALAALEVEGEALMRRLTELDLERLPAVGAIARGVPALIEDRGNGRYRMFVPQELGHFVAEVVADMATGLG